LRDIEKRLELRRLVDGLYIMQDLRKRMMGMRRRSRGV